MSKLSALQGKSKSFNIGGLELEFKPLRVNDLHLFNIDDKASSEEQMKQTNRLISKVLKDSVPDATDEEISNISAEYIEELMNAIMSVNGFKNDKIDLIKQKLKQ